MIQLHIENNIAKIALNRPDVFNSFNREMALLLQKVLNECAHNPQVRAIILTGNGKAFCAGQDLNEVINPNLNPGFEVILEEHYNPIIQLIRQIKKPIIAAVNGVAAGAGANIALACDIVVASEQASFIQAFSKIGLVPDSAGTFFLPRLIGFQRASALMILGDKVSAEEALKMGMIYKIYPASFFEDEVQNLASTVAKMPTKAIGLTKTLLNQAMSNNLTEQLDLESKCQIEASQSFDFKEGVEAFINKRNPEFIGD
ncbi:2-(1,2-epoxy-1,2-dihydrophenyl)acetyl-CoA isomerase [Flavobacterium branchiophilum NBRC 15030 = ATCC 35035]|uniref:2-(1,2-epoxy-1,2-dihydrophenyl)acetyl-CoA isomerase n=1 Tax=Flavobacterium branchiophilum TaxID=55197 RepID=A0A543G7G3_9FLAO|nr:enoyl-CoA hydratase-related protein [Flavobacterium branchiophilum]OXA71978.1 2-(1,2-epoxy-1,2-dihydrophenyl)acetyl-CoA isomerase [Flavobacterium branchiophilum NBRC 15030 = ATCC 35035]TQM42017.1 2-(1,2-epoxy-1,2-dihydrophenyl)acetyl-CoA isomerase [Flavobacterium branchiophilum]GEM53788.1 2-(1,2-epoxy-1,2-dihydrophenyl)acetyl-CoA isomerase [Flavobacterium branchiophilum NBRC 15030 = ATCC 35035]